MTATTSTAPPLPGLEAFDERRPMGDVEAGVRRTLAALNMDARLSEHDAGRTAIAISLARIISKKEATGRLSTVSNDARLLVELLDAFVVDPEATEVDDRLAGMLDKWSAMADTVVAPGHGAP